MTPLLSAAAPALRAGEPIASDAFARLRRRMALDFCKWDPQVGDASTLAPFPLRIPRDVWRTLAATAESLAAEAIAAERELIGRPDLWPLLDVPRPIRAALLGSRIDGPRVMRFDFHPTRDGDWRISEVNADVPGGFTEGSALPALMAEHVAGAVVAGDPLAAWADVVARHGRSIGLVAAPGFIEDQQVIAGVAREIRARHPSASARLVGPRQLAWRGDVPFVDGEPLDAVVRFVQAEWLPSLVRREALASWFASPRVLNPGRAILIESKRLPLAFDALRTPMPTWRRSLPETRDPRDAPWRRDDGWLLKSAFCNTGDAVSIRDGSRRWRRAARAATWRPRGWVAQRRFEPAPLATPLGPMFPCVGVFTVDGRACGAYCRLSHGPVVDWRAIDVALLIDEGESEA